MVDNHLRPNHLENMAYVLILLPVSNVFTVSGYLNSDTFLVLANGNDKQNFAT